MTTEKRECEKLLLEGGEAGVLCGKELIWTAYSLTFVSSIVGHHHSSHLSSHAVWELYYWTFGNACSWKPPPTPGHVWPLVERHLNLVGHNVDGGIINLSRKLNVLKRIRLYFVLLMWKATKIQIIILRTQSIDQTVLQVGLHFSDQLQDHLRHCLQQRCSPRRGPLDVPLPGFWQGQWLLTSGIERRTTSLSILFLRGGSGWSEGGSAVECPSAGDGGAGDRDGVAGGRVPGGERAASGETCSLVAAGAVPAAGPYLWADGRSYGWRGRRNWRK